MGGPTTAQYFSATSASGAGAFLIVCVFPCAAATRAFLDLEFLQSLQQIRCGCYEVCAVKIHFAVTQGTYTLAGFILNPYRGC
jgi:hypothetical protein